VCHPDVVYDQRNQPRHADGRIQVGLIDLVHHLFTDRRAVADLVSKGSPSGPEAATSTSNMSCSRLKALRKRLG